ncbi:MAG: glycosyltransferase [Clostridia bacterium]
MKKVLFLIHTLNGGGAEKVLVNLITHLDKEKYDITVMTIVNEGIYIDKILDIPGVKYKYIFNTFFDKFRKDKEYKYNKYYIKLMNIIWTIYKFIIKYFKISKIVITEKYDIEVAFLEGMCAKIIANSNNKEAKKIAWIHTDLNKLTKSSLTFKNKQEEIECYKKFDKIICVSKGVRKQFAKKMGFSDKVIVKLNAINSEEILKLSREKVTDIKKPEGFLIVSVGRLIPEKGYDRLLSIHKRLIEEGIKHTLWIIGDGNDKEILQKYIIDNNLQKTAKLLGFKDNPYSYIKLSDLFVCSSRVEGLSTVLCEAMILSKPIVTTRCPGVSELLGNTNKYAFITKNEEEDLYFGLKLVLTDKEIYNKYVKRAKEKSSSFVLEESVKEIEQVLDLISGDIDE